MLTATQIHNYRYALAEHYDVSLVHVDHILSVVLATFAEETVNIEVIEEARAILLCQFQANQEARNANRR